MIREDYKSVFSLRSASSPVNLKDCQRCFPLKTANQSLSDLTELNEKTSGFNLSTV